MTLEKLGVTPIKNLLERLRDLKTVAEDLDGTEINVTFNIDAADEQKSAVDDVLPGEP